MDNSVLETPPPFEGARITLLRESLAGQSLATLLQKLKQQCGLSDNQLAVSAGIDESAFHKILNGEHREFRAEHVDALLEDLQTLQKLTDNAEIAIWKKELRIAAFIHYDFYKAVEPRLNEVHDRVERERILSDYLPILRSALSDIYDKDAGRFPILIPFVTAFALYLSEKQSRDQLGSQEWVGQIIKSSYRHRVQKQFEASVRELTNAIQIDPNNVSLHHERGLAYLEWERYGEAIEDFDSTLKIDPTYYAAYHNRGIAWLQLGKYEEAIKDCDKAISLNPQCSECLGTKALVLRARGLVYLEREKYTDAIEDYTNSLEIDPTNYAAYHNRGFAWYRLGKYQQAIQDCNEALSLNPKCSECWGTRSAALSQLRKYIEAFEDICEAVELDPDRYRSAYEKLQPLAVAAAIATATPLRTRAPLRRD